MSKKINFFKIVLFIIITTFRINAQNKIIISENIILPKDSTISKQLLKSFDNFLVLKENPNKDNIYVLKEDLLETSILLDEMKGLEKSEKFKDDHFYKCYLNNIIPINKTEFLIQFSYIGANENTPVLLANFEILAKNKENKFYFYSPIKRNTNTWKNKNIGDFTFYFKKSINQNKVKEYIKKVAFFDKKLNNPNKKVIWYGCENMYELLQIIGVKYKLIYNSRNSSTFSSIENNSTLIVSGDNNSNFDSYDPHDLWHDRLHTVLPTNLINKPIDEGCAYLYGGSWGIEWKEILKQFKIKVSSNPKADWLSLYEQFYNFGENKEKHLIVGYVINALIVEKIEKEKGFNSVIEFLSCGKYEKTNKKYFESLEKILGINRANFNDSIWKLIKESK